MLVECAVYEDGRRKAGDLPLEHACEAGQEDGAFVWVGLFEPTADEFEALRSEFSLHPLAVEDALSAHQRPKIERYGDMTFVVLKTARYVDEAEAVVFGQVMVFVGDSYVITVRHGEVNDLSEVRRRVEEDESQLRRGPAGALHAILDSVVDAYEPVAAGLQTDVDQAEEELFGGLGGRVTVRIYELGREVLKFSRAVGPLIPAVEQLVRGGPGVDDEMTSYFRDVLDHLIRVNGHVDSMHELLSNMLQANLTQVSVRQNEDMRKISAWVAILAIPTMIAGIYGMNFDHMPELHWQYGYPLVLGVILVACSVLYARFKRSGWL
ncbi:MAG TPA: magnesium/cobalt transporter CorA [Solirubrobacteraceae bacterium]